MEVPGKYGVLKQNKIETLMSDVFLPIYSEGNYFGVLNSQGFRKGLTSKEVT